MFRISGSNEQLQQEFEYTLLKPDCHTWWISKMQSGREDTLKERYAIKLCFKLGKMQQKCMECIRLLLEHLAWIEYQFLSGIRDSRKPGSLWGMIRGVGGVRKSIHQSWLAKELGVGLGLLCWDFKGVQEEIPWEEASTLQIGSVAFPPGQYTSPQLVIDYLTKMGIKRVPHSPYNPDLTPCDFWLFPKLRGNWGDERGCDEGDWHAHTRRLRWGLPEDVGTVEQVHCSRRRLLGRGLEFHVCTINKSAHTKKVWKLIEWSSYVSILRIS